MKRKGTVGSLGECNQTGRRPSPHEGRRAFSIFDPPSMEPCRGKHTARARIPEGSSPQTPTFGPALPSEAHRCLRRWRSAPARESSVTLVCEPPEGLPLSRPRATGCADLPHRTAATEMSARAGN